MDTFVNIRRALNQIRNGVKRNKRIFCIFLDFKSAYNTIPHKELFEKLNCALSGKEIQLLKAIYTRLKIRLGNESIRYNNGVAQGNMISPVLFDIYAEDLLWELCNKGWDLQSVLAYADDHLILCNSVEELKRAIQLVNEWCSRSKIILNPKKSGILEVISRRSKPSLKYGNHIEGIPVVQSYRCLGLLIDSKLTGDDHVTQMNRKINFLNCKLTPLLSKVSFDYRCNLWKVLVKPLYKPVLALMAQNNITRVRNLEINLKKSFKRFTGLSKSTDDAVLGRLVSFDFSTLARYSEQTALRKLSLRCQRMEIDTDKPSKHQTPILPKNFIKFNNIQKTRCPACLSGARNNLGHLKIAHKLWVPSSLEMIEKLESEYPRDFKYDKRKDILERRDKVINFYFTKILDHIRSSS